MAKQWYEASELVNGIPLTRYVASYYIGGGKRSAKMVNKWLDSLIINKRHLTPEEQDLVASCVMLGKFELEESVRKMLA